MSSWFTKASISFLPRSAPPETGRLAAATMFSPQRNASPMVYPLVLRGVGGRGQDSPRTFGGRDQAEPNSLGRLPASTTRRRRPRRNEYKIKKPINSPAPPVYGSRAAHISKFVSEQADAYTNAVLGFLLDNRKPQYPIQSSHAGAAGESPRHSSGEAFCWISGPVRSIDSGDECPRRIGDVFCLL